MKASLLLLLPAITGCGSPAAELVRDEPLPWELRAQSWRTDPAWYDGLAEVAVYDGTRTIYGIERRFEATIYTNKQRMDRVTTVKSDAGGGVECFKQHTSERVPTENYDYDFSTAAFIESSDLSLFKLTASSQDDCGSSFRHLTRADSGGYRFFESVYFPGAGIREVTLPDSVVAYDSLPLVLRDWPAELERAELRVVPAQKHQRRQPVEPRNLMVVHAGTEDLTVPAGSVACRRLELHDGDAVVAKYWFALEAAAPWLHVLVAHEGPEGVSYRLKALERKAYWER